jgi:hypothetical protein
MKYGSYTNFCGTCKSFKRIFLWNRGIQFFRYLISPIPYLKFKSQCLCSFGGSETEEFEDELGCCYYEERK